MVLAADEIGVSKDHAGILVINELAKDDLVNTDFEFMTGKSLTDFLSDQIVLKILENANRIEESTAT